jgi:hypothetical protein
MKKLLSHTIIMIVILGSCQTYAQFQNNRRGSGMDRTMGTDSRYNAPEKRKPVDHVKMMTDNMTTKLNLDGFQSAIVKNIIEDFTKTVNEIAMLNIPNDAKTEKSNLAKATMETKFAEILNDKQKVLFENLLKESNGKEKKKKKKNRNDTDSEE